MKYATYQSYKFSGTDWIGEIPSNWECRRLKDCGALLAGAGFPHEYQGLEDEELPFYKVGDLSQSLDGRHMASGEHTISRKTAYTLRAKVIPPSAIVYAKIGAALLLNRRRITVKDCCIDNNMTAFIPNQRRVSTAWAHYWLSALDFGEFTNPGAVPSLSEGYQATLPITLPPLDEQQTIARFLDAKTAQIDALVAQKRQLIDKLKEKRQALIARTVTRGLPPEAAKAAGLDPAPAMKDSGVEWFDFVPTHWQIKQLKWAVLFQRGHDLPSEQREDGDVPLVTSAGVSATHNKAAAKGPGIVTGRYGTIGQFYLIEDDYWPLNTTLYSIDLRGNLSEYLCYMLEHLSPLVLLHSVKSAVPGVDRNDLHPTMIALPPVPEQKAIAEYLNVELMKLFELASDVEAVISRLTEYRQALITSAVTGKIDVRNWQATAEAA